MAEKDRAKRELIQRLMKAADEDKALANAFEEELKEYDRNKKKYDALDRLQQHYFQAEGDNKASLVRVMEEMIAIGSKLVLPESPFANGDSMRERNREFRRRVHLLDNGDYMTLGTILSNDEIIKRIRDPESGASQTESAKSEQRVVPKAKSASSHKQAKKIVDTTPEEPSELAKKKKVIRKRKSKATKPSSIPDACCSAEADGDMGHGLLPPSE